MHSITIVYYGVTENNCMLIIIGFYTPCMQQGLFEIEIDGK